MHTLEIYSIRVHDHMLPGNIDERYADLSNIRGHNLVDVLIEALNQGGEYIDLREMIHQQNPEKDIRDIVPRIFSCTNINQVENIITGYLNVGEYGTQNDIVNRVSGNIVGEVEIDDSVIRNHFFYIEIRPNQRQAIFYIQAIRGRGAKTVFEEIIHSTVRRRTGGLKCQIRPLAHRGLVNDWYQNAEICEIRMSRFANNDPMNDISDRLGDSYTEIKIKPKTRNARLGKLVDLDQGLIDILQGRADIVKAQVEYNGRKRVFQLGSDDEPVSSIELDEEDPNLNFEGGNPTFDSARQFAANLSEDIWPVIVEA